MYQINASKLGSIASASNKKVYLSKEAESECKQTFQEFKKLWYGSRMIAWKYRNRSQFWNDAATAGELDQFEVNKPGVRLEDGSYSKSEKYDLDQANLYLWNKFNGIWQEAVPFYKGNMKSYKDLKNAQLELVKLVYHNWGHHLLEDYEPVVEPLDDKCHFYYDIEEHDIHIQGNFTLNKREIILKSEGINNVTIIQTKGERGWKAGIYFNSENLVMNSSQALTFSKMLELASKLNVGIKDFMENPELFLGIESGKTLMQKLRFLKDIIIEINEAYLAERNRRKQEENQKLSIKEEIVGNSSNSPKIKQETKGGAKERKLKQKAEISEWLSKNPEFKDDFDSQVGISQVDVSSNLSEVEMEELDQLGYQIEQSEA